MQDADSARALEPSLRLFPEPAGDDAATTQLSPQTTLGQFFDRWYLPQRMSANRPGNRRAYRESIKYWRQATGDPSLCDIDQVTCQTFIAGLVTMRGKTLGTKMAPKTIAKHCGHVQTVLRRTGPYAAGRQDRHNQELLARVPYLESPACDDEDDDHFDDDEPRDSFSLDEIAALLVACESMTRPVLATVDWWRAIVIVTYNTGARLQTLMGLEWSMYDGRYFRAPRRIMKRHKQRLYVNATARRWLEKVRGDSPYIFPWPYVTKKGVEASVLIGNPHGIETTCNATYPDGNRALEEHRSTLEKTARVRALGFHGLRRAHATQLVGLGVDMRLAQESLGHAREQTTREHYVTLDAALELLPQPAGA